MKKKFIFTKKDLILVLILAVTILIVNYSLNWYKVYREYNLNKSIIASYIPEVSYEEYKTYMQEVSTGFIYYCIADNKECRSFENQFKRIVSKYGLSSNLVYLNTKDLSIGSFYNTYANNNIDARIPLIVYFEDHYIVDYINNDNSDMTEKEIVKFFNKYN